MKNKKNWKRDSFTRLLNDAWYIYISEIDVYKYEVRQYFFYDTERNESAVEENIFSNLDWIDEKKERNQTTIR